MSYHERVKRHQEENDHKPSVHEPQGVGSKIKGWIISIVVLILAYGAINLVLVGGQNAIKGEDQTRFDTLKSQLESEKILLEQQEAVINSDEERLLDIQAEMDSYEAQGLTGAYNSLVDTHNALLDSIEVSINDYNSKLPSFNARVDEANKLAESIGSTWYLVPVPTGRH